MEGDKENGNRKEKRAMKVVDECYESDRERRQRFRSQI